MTDESAQPIPEEFVQQARDALLHYYDYAYLARHPLLAQLRHPSTDPTVAVMELRRLLLMAVQQLRPAASVPPEHPAWRPYRVLHERCILGKDWSQVEVELSLSKRQLQREQQDGFVAAALTLWRAQQLAQPQSIGGAPAADALMQEINRTAPERTTFDASEQLGRALAAAQTIAARYGVTLVEHAPETDILVAGNPLIFRQIVLSLLSLMLRSGAVRTLVVRLGRQDEKVLCALLASLIVPSEEAPPH
jgi:signal transduction histidine kinase